MSLKESLVKYRLHSKVAVVVLHRADGNGCELERAGWVTVEWRGLPSRGSAVPCLRLGGCALPPPQQLTQETGTAWKTSQNMGWNRRVVAKAATTMYIDFVLLW